MNDACSGSVIAPRVVLTAGHCGSKTHTYRVVAPNAAHQSVTASRDWTPYDGDQRATPDIRLIFLDAPIHLASYPVVSKRAIAAGTRVVDIGRARNGPVTSELWVSPVVTIEGSAAGLGFPHHDRARRDLSEHGDSGGPILRLAGGSHEIVGTVDTDTVEHHLAGPKIDLFVRMDRVSEAIEEQVAAHGGHGR